VPTLTLVLLPGMDGSGLLFAEFVAALGTDVEARIVRYPPQTPLGYAELETLVRAALPSDRPFVLLAESFSGPLAISIAAAAPATLRGLILCCTFARLPLPLGLRALARWVPTSSLRAGRWTAHVLFGRHATPARLATLTAAVESLTPAVRAARLRALLDVDARDQLARIEVPTLCLHAADDRIMPRAAARLLVKRIPRATLHELAAPHGLLQTLPDEAARVVKRFLQQTLDAG
jgi:pimeloyl-ACP methyl ester carboxylesterase